jgi:hypothetical protein
VGDDNSKQVGVETTGSKTYGSSEKGSIEAAKAIKQVMIL